MGALNNSIKGGCLCGAICFEITSPFLSMVNCYCSACRKQHGTAFSTYCRIEKSGLHIKTGKSDIQRYASSDFAERSFCINCGTKLSFAFNDSPNDVWVSAGALDDDLNLSPEYNIFVGSKAPWYGIEDELAGYEGYPDGVRRG